MPRSSTPFPLLRTFLSTCYRTSRFLFLNYFLTIAGIGITVYGYAQNVLWGTVSLGVSAAAVLVTIVTWYRGMREYYVRPLESVDTRKLQVSPLLLGSGYEIRRRAGRPGDALLTSRPVNEALFGGATAALSIARDGFRARHASAVSYLLLQEFVRSKRQVLFNGKKIRLRSDPQLDGDQRLAPVGIQPTHYFDTLITNDALGVSIRSRGDNERAFDGHDFCFPAAKVPGCQQSGCANQVGTSTLAVTSDNYLVITGQSGTNAFSQRLWAPSGSGSADWRDVGANSDLQTLVAAAARRELTEEAGLCPADVAWLRIIGYGRLLHRGGLPQFFCVSRLTCPLDRVRITRPERPLVDYHTKIYLSPDLARGDAVHAVMRELRANGAALSSALWWCLELLSGLAEEDLAAVLG